MKKILYTLMSLTILAAASCEGGKEAEEVQSGTIVTIRAAMDGDTRTVYGDGRTFGWVEGDQIAVVVSKDEDGSLDVVTFTTAESGSLVSFSGTVPAGYSLTGYALYPKQSGSYAGYNNLSLASSELPLTLKVAGTIVPGDDDLMSLIPLVAVRKENGQYGFKTAAGVLKVTVANIPAGAYYLALDGPDDTAFNGNFVLDEDAYLKMENIQGTAWPQKYIYFGAEAGSTKDFYFPLPEGTIPAGTTLTLFGAEIYLVQEFKKEVVIKRNVVTSTPMLTYHDYALSLSVDGISVQDAAVTAGINLGSDVAKASLFVAAGLDEASLSAGQERAVDVTEGGSVAVPMPSGAALGDTFYLVAVGYDGEGASVASVSQEFTYEAMLSRIALTADRLTLSHNCTWEGGGAAALVDGDLTSYWHSDWYYPLEGADPVYGLTIDMALPEPLAVFQLNYWVRSTNNNCRPTHIVLGVSDDGEVWTQVADFATEEMDAAAAGAKVELSAVAPGQTFKYLRFGFAGSAQGDLRVDFADAYPPSASLAEIELFGE